MLPPDKQTMNELKMTPRGRGLPAGPRVPCKVGTQLEGENQLELGASTTSKDGSQEDEEVHRGLKRRHGSQ
jgi:hypothetical protein